MNADRIPRGEPGSVCPKWVIDGWYANDDRAQKAAIARWSLPVTTAAERRSAQSFTTLGISHPCAGCGRFAFPDARTICFWCRR